MWIKFTPPLQETPLHKAASNGCVDAIQYLTEAGADLNIKNIVGVSDYFYVPYSHEAGADIETNDKVNE